jgi:hypothetical protein
MVLMLITFLAGPVDLAGLRCPAAQHGGHGASVAGQQLVAVTLFEVVLIAADERGQFHDYSLRRSTRS